MFTNKSGDLKWITGRTFQGKVKSQWHSCSNESGFRRMDCCWLTDLDNLDLEMKILRKRDPPVTRPTTRKKSHESRRCLRWLESFLANVGNSSSMSQCAYDLNLIVQNVKMIAAGHFKISIYSSIIHAHVRLDSLSSTSLPTVVNCNFVSQERIINEHWTAKR